MLQRAEATNARNAILPGQSCLHDRRKHRRRAVLAQSNRNRKGYRHRRPSLFRPSRPASQARQAHPIPTRNARIPKTSKHHPPAALTIDTRLKRTCIRTTCLARVVKLNCSTGRPILFVPENAPENTREIVAMTYQSETPFDNIESAREYVNQLLAATHEAQAEIETELRRATDPQLARRQQALQLVKYKLIQLASHIAASRRILNDLTKLRRLLLDARKV